jgi:uncharacterized protein YodC (DUF2158 family)
MEFKVGDTVKMRTGNSPIMTIIRVISGQFQCIWQDGHGVKHEGTFDAEWLEHCDEPQD